MIKRTSYHAADGDTRLGGGNESFCPKQERSGLIRGSSLARPHGTMLHPDTVCSRAFFRRRSGVLAIARDTAIYASANYAKPN